MIYEKHCLNITNDKIMKWMAFCEKCDRDYGHMSWKGSKFSCCL